MAEFSGFAPVPIRGPHASFGPFPAVPRFFADPIGHMQTLRREYGELVAVADRSPALICAFGPEYNRQVLGNGAVFQNDTRLPIRAPTAAREDHRKYRRLLMAAFSKSSVQGYAADMVAMAELTLRRCPPLSRAAPRAERQRHYLLNVVAQKREQHRGQRDALSLMIEAHDEDGSPLSDAR